MEATERLVSGLGIPNPVTIDDDLGVEELAEFYGGAALVVGMRLHSTILGLVGGTPSLPFSFSLSHKADAVFASLGLETFVIHPDADSPLGVAQKAVETVRDEGGRERVATAVSGARQDVRKVVARLSRL